VAEASAMLNSMGMPIASKPPSSFGIPQGYFPPNAPPPLAPVQAPRAVASYINAYQPQIGPTSYGAPYQTSPMPSYTAQMAYGAPQVAPQMAAGVMPPMSSQMMATPQMMMAPQTTQGSSYPQTGIPPSVPFNDFGGSMLQVDEKISAKTENEKDSAGSEDRKAQHPLTKKIRNFRKTIRSTKK